MRMGIWCLCLAVGIPGCAELEADGQRVFWETGCARCHDADGSGGVMGPPLVDLSEIWTPSELDRFLKNPEAYAEHNVRLKTLKMAYATPMPQLNIPPDRRKILVEFLLSDAK